MPYQRVGSFSYIIVSIMIKKDYMKPTMRVVQLQYRQNILIASAGIQATSDDDDNPIYDGNSSGSIWDAN